MPNWQSLEAKNRLLAAILAAHTNKKLLDYRRIATYYGEGATYDAIEGQFRKIRVEASKMRAEVDDGTRPEAPARGKKKDDSCTPTKARKPRNLPKKNDGVISGRVTKSETPTKKRGVDMNAVKGFREDMESSASSMMEDITGSSFADSDAHAVEGYAWSLGDQDAYGEIDLLGDGGVYEGTEV